VNPSLHAALIDIGEHVASAGWDQPPRLYALVETANLLREEPTLAAALGIADGSTPELPALTAVEQDNLGGADTLDTALERITWGPAVEGCALAVERLMLPPTAEADLPADPAEANAFAAAHPDRQEVRLVVGVLRDGSRDSAVRLRSDDRPEAVFFGPDLVPALAEALHATFDS
jgi:hypothetical protein